jgi:2-polyprenyl-3-methyl-5-hydroxy-6-metoxy-1,4-benzoquinol methylase
MPDRDPTGLAASAEMIEGRVAQHYARTDLERAIVDARVASGNDLGRLAPSDLSPVDDFHTGGRQATVEFAAQIDFAPGAHVLDIGCGLGTHLLMPRDAPQKLANIVEGLESGAIAPVELICRAR